MDGLLNVCIEVPSLPSHIANAKPIQQAENGAVEPSQQAGNGSRACLTGIFSESHIAPPMEPIFAFPVMAHEVEHAVCWGLAQREIAESIDNLVAHLPRVEDAGGAFQAKDLLNPLPLLGKPRDFDQGYR